MDCPSEENLIRLKLEGFTDISHLDFDIPNRKLSVYHHGKVESIEESLHELDLNTHKLITEQVDKLEREEKSNQQKKLLWAVLGINFVFFLVEVTFGLLSNSMGLVGDSLDMLADAIVYGISLLAVGKSVIRKKQVAKYAGYFQVVLAMMGFYEVIRRFISNTDLPEFKTMIIVSVFALIANWYCLYLLGRSSGKNDAHMKASLIFTSNDIIINIGVILAGILVLLTNTGLPDLIIGFIVFLLVTKGAIRILALGK